MSRCCIVSCSFLSGPGVNKAVLLQFQQEKEKDKEKAETNSHMRQVYDNISYEGNEIKQDPYSNTVDESGSKTVGKTDRL